MYNIAFKDQILRFELKLKFSNTNSIITFSYFTKIPVNCLIKWILSIQHSYLNTSCYYYMENGKYWRNSTNSYYINLFFDRFRFRAGVTFCGVEFKNFAGPEYTFKSYT